MYNEEEEEINRLIDEAADKYQPLDAILEHNGLTFKEALSAAEELQNRFFYTLNNCGIKSRKIEQVCFDVVSLLKREQNDDILFLYTSLLSERGLFFGDITEEEQKIRVWLAHRECADYLNERIRAERILRKRFDVLVRHKPNKGTTEYNKDEQRLLYKISAGHGFLARDMGDIYFENLGELIRKVNSDVMYSKIKPYIYSAVITRKREYMLTHKHYSPNISTIFKCIEYNIHKDNGKNFNVYQAYVELYYNIREHYKNESDIALSDHCFANLSNLSEWFYENCDATGDIPMTLHQVIEWLAEIVDVWYTSGNDVDGSTVTEILTEATDFIL